MSDKLFIQQESRGAELVRWISTSLLAAVITTLLLLGMDRLIFSEPVHEDPGVTYVAPNPIYVPRIIETRREPPPEKIEEPVEPPKLTIDLPKVDIESTQIAMREPIKIKPPASNAMSFNAAEPIPNVLVQPEYPSAASRRGIEGYVDLQFDVNPMGATENITVLQAEPARIFDRAAVRAVKRWKFTPIQKDGKPATYKGMTHKITFKLEG